MIDVSVLNVNAKKNGEKVIVLWENGNVYYRPFLTPPDYFLDNIPNFKKDLFGGHVDEKSRKIWTFV